MTPAHTTADEIAFLSKLGTYWLPDTMVPRRDLLILYRVAMPLRSNWGYINRARIRAEVERLLTEERS